ncbi:hypothetical protein [Micromonospora sp. NPDC006431]|uniref:hypothetical protein n=1 Tax=Micromonospora sp. NPDC006431 TaxID=3364235 RepID=UPI0036A00FA1
MTQGQGDTTVAPTQGRPKEEQDHNDRQRQWLQNLLSDMRQSQLDFYGELIDKVDNDRYPSPAMLDTIERGLPPELYSHYIAVLMDKVADSKYPSPTLLARLQRLTILPAR